MHPVLRLNSNYNLVRRINRELDGDVRVEALRHEARWNDELARIEMHLVAKERLEFSVSGHLFALEKGETNPHREQP